MWRWGGSAKTLEPEAVMRLYSVVGAVPQCIIGGGIKDAVQGECIEAVETGDDGIKEGAVEFYGFLKEEWFDDDSSTPLARIREPLKTHLWVRRLVEFVESEEPIVVPSTTTEML